MFLTISTTHRPATDLGYLLAKNPGRLHSFSLSFGQAHVFYPHAGEDFCEAALYVDVDPIGLVRRKDPSGYSGSWLGAYVNDRPYVASSFLSVALGRVFGTALTGSSRERPDLAELPIPLQATVTALPCRGGESLLRRLFEPLGYEVKASRLPLDERFPSWGESHYFEVTVNATCRISELLRHLYVLMPVLDDEKHYWVGEDEVEKLLRRGEGWLSGHPERNVIVNRYLRHRRMLTRRALDQLLKEEAPSEEAEAAVGDAEEAIERPLGLHEQRLRAVAAVLGGSGASRVLDLGCGAGKLIQDLLQGPVPQQVVGVDVSSRSLERAAEALKLDRPPARGRVELIQGSLTYRDRRLQGFGAAAVVEVIEHLDPGRLEAFESVLFEHARPGLIVMTTPNAEYNALFEGLAPGEMRHPDHRFEWTRAQFKDWAAAAAHRHGYTMELSGIGPADDELGQPTQMVVFRR
jgi:3' terminal RNA ribose 2'-O-methyltransferase Hen1